MDAINDQKQKVLLLRSSVVHNRSARAYTVSAIQHAIDNGESGIEHVSPSDAPTAQWSQARHESARFYTFRMVEKEVYFASTVELLLNQGARAIREVPQRRGPGEECRAHKGGPERTEGIMVAHPLDNITVLHRPRKTLQAVFKGGKVVRGVL